MFLVDDAFRRRVLMIMTLHTNLGRHQCQADKSYFQINFTKKMHNDSI